MYHSNLAASEIYKCSVNEMSLLGALKEGIQLLEHSLLNKCYKRRRRRRWWW